MGPSLQMSTCVLFWGFLGLFVPVVEGAKPWSSSVSSQANAIPSSVFLGHFVFALGGGTRRTNGRTDGRNGRCHGNEVTRCKAARDPYATCQISSWSDIRRRSYGDFSPTTRLAAVTLTSNPLSLKLVHTAFSFSL